MTEDEIMNQKVVDGFAPDGLAGNDFNVESFGTSDNNKDDF